MVATFVVHNVLWEVGSGMNSDSDMTATLYHSVSDFYRITTRAIVFFSYLSNKCVVQCSYNVTREDIYKCIYVSASVLFYLNLNTCCRTM